MEHDYHYIPEGELHSKNYPVKTDELIEEYEMLDEANDIANFEFGNDIADMEISLQQEFLRDIACGCIGCMTVFLDRKWEMYNATRIPDEDAGDAGPSLLHQLIKFHNQQE